MKDELFLIESQTCCTPGACNMMCTANTMTCIVEAMGLSLPGCATMSAICKEREDLSKTSGRIIMKLVEEAVKALELTLMNLSKMLLKLPYPLGVLQIWCCIFVLYPVRLEVP